MSIINHKFHATFTEDGDTYPSVDREINFTDSSSSADDKTRVFIKPSAEDTWQTDTPVKVLDVTNALVGTTDDGARVRYLLIETSSPVYLWFENDPTIVSPATSIATTPVVVERMMMIEGPGSGSIQKIWAVNPSRTTSVNPVTIELKMWYSLVPILA
jgi:hypothetical protein